MAAEPELSPDPIGDCLRADPRYPREAYAFISEALGYTVRQVNRPGHVSGRELCFGLRDYALEQFGALARAVLGSWGITRTEDIGNLVFNLVGVGILHKTESDSRDDFEGVFDFHQAFDASYRITIASEGDDERGR